MKNLKQQSGLSLIEVMIALVLGLLILYGAVSLFINNQRVYKDTNSMGRLQENARFALNLLIKDIRNTGYLGCPDNANLLDNKIIAASAADNIWNVSNTIEGLEGTGNWQPSNTTVLNPIKLRGDGITVRYLQPIAQLSVAMTSNESALSVPSTGYVISLLQTGAAAAIGDCRSVDIFNVSQNSTPSANPLIIDYNNSLNTQTNSAVILSKAYPEGSQVFRLVANRYYVADLNGIPSLYRVTENSSEALVEGIENLRFLYGVDNDSNGSVDNYVDAGAVTNWGNVISVEIALLARTINEDNRGQLNTKTYQLLDINYNPTDDRHRRRVFTSTVQIRNRSS